MAFPNIFDDRTTEVLLNRIDQLATDSQPQWGKMNVAQMMAHVNVPYDFVFTNKYKPLNPLMKTVMRLFVKKGMTNEKPFPKSAPTAKEFKVAPQQDFEVEKGKLKENVRRFAKLGEAHFDGKDYRSFGKMSAKEWSNLFYKHLDHHLRQFGV